MNMYVEKFSEGLALHSDEWSAARCGSFTLRTSPRFSLQSNSQHAIRGPCVTRRNYACGQRCFSRTQWTPDQNDLVNFVRLGKFGKQYLICNWIRLCYTENAVFFSGNFTVGEMRKIRRGKLHHGTYTYSTEHVPVTVCANLSCNFIE